MSYCVNCGVELADSEKRCPLCGVRVINPAAVKNAEDIERPYPENIQNAEPKLDERYVASLSGLLMLIPIGICLFIDLMNGSPLGWALYVVGALTLIYAVCFVPMLLPEPKWVIALFIDGACTTFYLWLVDRVSGGGWFWTVGFPLSTIAFALIIGITALFNAAKKMGVLAKIGIVLIAMGAYTMYTEWRLINVLNTPMTWWSVYALVPCVIIAVLLFILNLSDSFREQLRRRFFV